MTSVSENDLIKDLDEIGLCAMRAPGSGSRPGHYGGDLWIAKAVDMSLEYFRDGKLTELYVVEEKYSSTSGQKYVIEDGEKLDNMIEFSEEIGATPLFAVRWSTRVPNSPGAFHVVKDARLVERTESGNVCLKPETANETFHTLEEYFDER